MSTAAAAIAQKTCPRCGATYDLDALFCAKDGTKLEPEDTDVRPDSDPYIGTVISGDIEIVSVAGVGAMGRVYRAHQRGVDRNVAVKILHRELSGNAQLVARFHREAKIASKLQHPHVVEVYLAGQLRDGALYIVMEYLDGMSLAAALASAGGVFNPGRALSIALQLCDAVGEGHGRGIVHRDLKPENVMLVRRADMGDWVKVLDFGIAKVSLGEQSMQTAAGLVFGTARYISPEGAQGITVGPPGDVYSLATIVYQMLAGRTPFDAEPVGLLIKHIHEPPPPLTSWPRAADLHPALVKAVMGNLAKDPAHRAAGARAFASQLATAAKEANIAISEVGVVARLSNVDFGRASQVLDPTLDDVSLGRGHDRTPSHPVPAVVAASGDAVVVTPVRLPSEPTPVPLSEPASPRRRVPIVAVLTFLLGVAITAAVTQFVIQRTDQEHTAYLTRTRTALIESRYASPPGDNVRDLVAEGLKRWPDDPKLLEFKSQAAQELVTSAMASRSTGDIARAREVAGLALELDPSDHAAHILVDQYGDELKQPAGGLTGARVLVRLPTERARPAQPTELAAQIAVGGAAPRSVVNNPRFTVTGLGLAFQGVVLPAVPSPDGADWKASFLPPHAGSYSIVFEANTQGLPLRAERILEVTK